MIKKIGNKEIEIVKVVPTITKPISTNSKSEFTKVESLGDLVKRDIAQYCPKCKEVTSQVAYVNGFKCLVCKVQWKLK